MMRRFYLAVAVLLLFAGSSASAADTTWVQAHYNIWLPDVPKNMDTTIEFPNATKSYRKIFMIFTLGKYMCPGTPQYCGDWDYTVQNFLMTPGGDTVELGRLITPYANATNLRTPWTWQERYVFDVTDYYPLLRDTATVRTHYSGYSGGFTSNIKFAFIEGTPPRNVLNIERLWHGSYRFGDTSVAGIDSLIKPISLVSDTNAKSTELKFTITGHGSDDNGCSEFCKKYYQVIVNKSIAGQKDIWRDDCGFNHLYPQTGTWVYDRGNWCPGDLIHTNSHALAGIGGAASYDLDVDFENYIGSKNSPNTSWGSYIIDAAVIDYGGFNRTLDASLEDIVAPNNHEMHYREGPFTGNPIVRVMNTGSTTITSLKISYTAAGQTYYYTWNGSLPSLESVDIRMQEIFEVRYLTGNSNTFSAEIVEVNGQADEDASNNKNSSTFTAAQNWPMDIVIRFKTNAGQVGGGISESNWYLIEGGKDTIKRREFNLANKIFEDTLHLGPSFYSLVVTDGGCDGLKFWANPGAGTGFITVSPVGGPNFALDGYFSGDFGCGFTQRFNTTWPAAISTVDKTTDFQLEIYPNPAGNEAHINLLGFDKIDGKISVLDAVGRVVMEKACTTGSDMLNLGNLSNGIYTVRFVNANEVKLQSRLVIAK